MLYFGGTKPQEIGPQGITAEGIRQWHRWYADLAQDACVFDAQSLTWGKCDFDVYHVNWWKVSCYYLISFDYRQSGLRSEYVSDVWFSPIVGCSKQEIGPSIWNQKFTKIHRFPAEQTFVGPISVRVLFRQRTKFLFGVAVVTFAASIFMTCWHWICPRVKQLSGKIRTRKVTVFSYEKGLHPMPLT